MSAIGQSSAWSAASGSAILSTQGNIPLRRNKGEEGGTLVIVPNPIWDSAAQQSVNPSFKCLFLSPFSQFREDRPDQEPEEASCGGAAALPPLRPRRRPHRETLPRPPSEGE